MMSWLLAFLPAAIAARVNEPKRTSKDTLIAALEARLEQLRADNKSLLKSLAEARDAHIQAERRSMDLLRLEIDRAATITMFGSAPAARRTPLPPAPLTEGPHQADGMRPLVNIREQTRLHMERIEQMMRQGQGAFEPICNCAPGRHELLVRWGLTD